MNKSVQQVQEELKELQQENRRQARIIQILQRVRFNGRVLKDCTANEEFIIALPQTMTPDQVSEAFAANPKLAEPFLWMDPPVSRTDPKQKAKDLETLRQAAKSNGHFGASEANLSLARSVLGAGFSQADLIQAVVSRRIVLAGPSDEERQQWEAERLDAEKLRLMSTPAHKLREEAAQGILDRRAQAQAEEKQRAFEAKQEAEDGMKFPPLPEFLPDFLAKRFGNQRLDRNFLVKKADREIFKWLHARFGAVAVEERFRGIR